jgi:DNA repair protein RecN (Recombination protein N)
MEVPAAMLRFLSINNLAVIEHAEIEFAPGFNVMTGETGAGKSMLVEAIGLLLGGRASADIVRTGADQTQVQAVVEDHDGRNILIRREVTSQGRSRAFLDGALVTASALRDATAPLVELHGQHEHQALLDPATHIDYLDDYADLEGARRPVAEAFFALQALQKQIAASELDERERAARIELIGFQVAELDRAAPRAGEDTELEAERRVLANADRIQRLCMEAYALLYESDQAALSSLAQVWRRVGELAEIDAAFRPHLDARETCKSELEELARVLRSYSDRVDASPARLQQTDDRLAVLERMKRKYGPRLDDVVSRHGVLRAELDLLTSAGERGEALQQAATEARERFLMAAAALSSDRRTAARRFARDLESVLAELAMERARFDVRFSDDSGNPAAWTARGTDGAEFFLSANPGEDLRALARIASGGELSRIMLAFKALVAARTPGATMIFDEVDAGIGGRVADVVGRRLRRLAEGFQVLCITHLPQLAAYATTHFQIEKRLIGGRTVTSVSRLSDSERIEELARMIAGASVSDRARASASELLDRGRGGDRARTRKADGGEHKSKGERAKAKERNAWRARTS